MHRALRPDAGSSRAMKTLLTGAVILTGDESETIHAPGDFVIDGDRIAYVGPRYDGEAHTRVDAGGHLLLPGFINAHTHSGMSIFRSLADDADLMAFLTDRVWPREIRLTPEDVYAGSVLSAIEMLKSGVTTYVDMYFFEDALAQAALDTGLRALITPTVLAVPEWEGRLGTWEQQLARGIAWARQWEGRDGRIHAGLGPHAPYTVPLDALAEIAIEAVRHDLPVNIHLVETTLERDNFNRRGRGSTARVLGELGFFDARVIAAHSIWVDPGDLDIYHRHRVGVAHCPQSNMKLGAGIAPVVAMLNHRVAVGLGTDGAATNNNLDLWEEMRLAPLLAKVNALDPTVLPAHDAFALATRLGAEAIHLPDIGVLAPGRKADVVMLDLAQTTAVPIFEPGTYLDHVVYSMGRESVDSVWVNGRRVVQEGEVLHVDEAAVREAAQRAALAVSERAAATAS